MLRTGSLLSALRSALSRLAGDRCGASAVTFAIALLPLLAATGAALDYARAAQARSRLQAIVDQAVLAGLKELPANRSAAAETLARSALAAERFEPEQVAFSPTSNGLRGRLKVRTPVLLGRLLGTEGLVLGVGAEGIVRAAAEGGAPSRVCILLLDPSATESLRVQGGAKIAAPGCAVHVHSSATVAASFAGGTSVEVGKVCLKGAGYSAQGAPKLGPVETGCRVVADPFVGQFGAPADQPCRFTDRVIQGQGRPVELEPGVYCGTTTVAGASSVVLKPGLYVLKGGPLAVSGVGPVSGSGVTLYLADAKAGLRVQGAVRLQLAAPQQGPLAGLLLYEPAGLPRSSLAFGGGSAQELTGLVYLPSRNLSLSGRSGMVGNSLTLVLNGLQLGGGAEWRLQPGPRSIAVPAPSAAATGEIILRH